MKRALPNENKPNDKGRSKRPEHNAEPIVLPTVVMDRRSTKAQNSTTQETPQMKALRERMKRDIAAYKDDITSSGIYTDDNYQYRHIILPKPLVRYLPDPKEEILLREHEYRRLGIGISSGWEHYMTYHPEPHILLLRRTHEVAQKLRKEREAILARQKKEQEEKERAKAETQPPPDNGTTESSTAATLSASKRTSAKPKATTTTTASSANDQQGTNDQA